MMNSSILNPRRFFRRSDRVHRRNSIPSPTLPNGPNDIYKFEHERLKTFEARWPSNHIDPNLLALTGMYYTGLRDCVKCQFCGVTINEWQPGDDPVGEHLKYSPTCPLLQRHCTPNVPLNAQALNRILPPSSPDECGGVCLGRAVSCSSPQVLPAFPHYALEDGRMTSFTEWPRVMKHKVPKFAEAGFFYTGRSDQVQCFSCGVVCKDWEEEDDPWVEHAVQQPDCKFVKLMRGNDFIDQCVADYEEKRRCSQPMDMPINPYDRQVSMASSLGAGDTDNNNACKLCYLEERNTVFLPCGHVVACAKCASSVDKCPVCRLPFTDVNRLYFS